MGNDLKDRNPDCGTIFFIILVLVFAMIYSDGSESQTLQSSGYSFHNKATTENLSFHFDAAIPHIVCITDLYKIGVSFLNNTGFNLFSSKVNITCYSQRVTRNLTEIQKINLEIRPLFIRRMLYNLSPGEKEDLPFLS